MKRLIGFVLIAIAIAGCTHDVDRDTTPFAWVHEFHTGAEGIFVNAYLVETQNNVVVIDATLLESTSKALREKLDTIGKPLKAVLLTHGHPDHYNGTTNLIAGKAVDVIATAGTDRVIREDDALKEKLWAPIFKQEWPTQRTFPNRIMRDGESIDVDGVRFSVHDLGKGESRSDSYWLMQDGAKKVAFIGDVVLNRIHAFVGDGHTSAWLKNIDRLKHELQGVDKLYPGHGDAGGLEILDWQRNYLLEYRRTIAALAQGKPTLTDDQKKQLTARMNEFLPNKRLEFLIGMGADSVAGELAREPK